MTKAATITERLSRISLLTCMAGLLVACLCLFGFQVYTFHSKFIDNTNALAEGVAKGSSFILLADDKEAADTALAPLKSQPNVMTAAFLLPDQRLFYTLGNGDKLNLPEVSALNSGHVFSGWMLIVKAPVTRTGTDETFGHLVLISDYGAELFSHLSSFALILICVLSASLWISTRLSKRMHREITDPLNRLTLAAKLIAQKHDYSVRAEKVADDEFGALTDAFNDMLHQIHTQASAISAAHEFQSDQLDLLRKEISERQRAERELAETHRTLLETSRQAGMAEVATGVLHNVGNVLNSVNVSVNCITDLVAKSKIANLSRLTSILPKTSDELATFIRDNDKGRVLPSYLPQLGNYLADEYAQIARETGLLGKNIEHIKDIISRQQTYAKISGIIEPHEIQPLIEDAIELNVDAFHRHSVDIVCNLDKVPCAAVDKHKVLQILINLLQNAKHAVATSNVRCITIGLAQFEDKIRVTVTDTGMGIRPENLNKVFTHGFTTRKDGHGFGLHSGANAAKEMGGQLTAHSDGEGKGATFILTLPLAENKIPKPSLAQLSK